MSGMRSHYVILVVQQCLKQLHLLAHSMLFNVSFCGEILTFFVTYFAIVLLLLLLPSKQHLMDHVSAIRMTNRMREANFSAYDTVWYL